MEAEAAIWNGFDFQTMGMASHTANDVWFLGIQTTGARQFDLKMVWNRDVWQFKFDHLENVPKCEGLRVSRS